MRRKDKRMDRNTIWQSIDVERRALAEDLTLIEETSWWAPSLCAGLTVREVLAHMTVSGTLSGPAWLAGVVRAGFDFDK
jgi:hypothetical protein